MIIERFSGLRIPITHKSCEDIKVFLNRSHMDYTGKQIIENIFYEEDNEYLLIPRYFPIEKYIPEAKIREVFPEGEDINIETTVQLRDDIQKQIVHYLMTNDNGIIQANPGAGKTVVSIFTIAHRKKKTFILVHRDSLVDQWRSRILQFTNLKEDEVIKLSSSNYEKLLPTAKIIICTNQTAFSLLSGVKRESFINAINNANIGMFIGDEVHTSVGAPTFSFTSIHIPCKYVYGLSATPYRYDNNTDVIKYHLGEVFVPKGKDMTMKANVNTLLVNSGVSDNRKRYLYFTGKFERSRYLSVLHKSKPFMDTIYNVIRKCIIEDRNIIIVSDRINLLTDLYNRIEYVDKGMFVGSAGNTELKHKIVFATTNKIRDGVDIPEKDCLIITNPVSNIEQLCGRVTRLHPDKKTPVVFDIVDINCKEISRSLATRIKYYNGKEWEIRYLSNLNGKLETIDNPRCINLVYNKES